MPLKTRESRLAERRAKRVALSKEERQKKSEAQKRRHASLSPEEKVEKARKNRDRARQYRQRPEVKDAARTYSRAHRVKLGLEECRKRAREARRRFCSDGQGKMYFIQATSGPIKIGFTTKRLEGRLQELQIGNHENLKVIAMVLTTREDEYRTHRRFAHLKIRGEWFRPETELLEFLRSFNVIT